MAKPLATTRHFQITRTMRQEFQLLEPGAVVPTVNELKKRFNASQATISQAMTRLQEEGLIRRPDGRNRLIISDMPPKAAMRISLIRPSWSSPDYDALTRAMVRGSERRGWALDVDASHSDMSNLDLNRGIAQNDAAILMSSMINMPSHLVTALRKPNRPVVTVLEVPDDPAISGVCADDQAVGNTAMEHLMAHGHREILTVISEPRSRSIMQRVQGGRSHLLEHAVSHADELILDCRIRPSEDSIAMTYESFCEFLIKPDRPRFTAIFCVAWTGALAVIKALHDVGNWKVPDDVSLVTYAGESLLIPFLMPPLTAVQTNVDQYSDNILELINTQIEEPQTPAQQVLVPCEIVSRESVIERKNSHTPQGI